MTNPEITIILPVYNGGHYLVESVNSVLTQSFTNFELLIIDDCSTDGSWKYLSGLTDSRVKLIKNETNQGLFYNLNFLIKKSSSDLIKLWAHDDIMLSNCLQSFVSFHNTHPEIGFSYSQRIMIDENGVIKENNNIDTTPEIISKELHALIAYCTGSIAGNIANVCIQKKALMKVGLFNETMKISADFDMWVRIAEFFPVGHINHKLIKLRDHKNQLSRNEKYFIEHVREDFTVYRKLDSYCDVETRLKGRKIMQKNKLLFYYTLMVKSFLKMNFKTTIKYINLINGHDNFFKITFYFIKSKIMNT